MATNETPEKRSGGLFINQLEPICAPATATGGAVAIVRVSGKGLADIVANIFQTATAKPLIQTASGHARFGHITDEDGQMVDECLVTLFRAPHSYTGEDCAEISLHGSAYIVSETLRLLCKHGCRMAEPGEFTQRAYLNGKMDLSQAEAVADLIASSSKAAHDVAINQLRGHFSDELTRLREGLQRLAALLELELDFDEHETDEFADRTELFALAQQAANRVKALAQSYDTGQALKNGVPVAIVGKTNVGKSTLLNRLLKDERAIVSDTHGTTRDTVEDTVLLNGVPFRFIDTAGLRHTDDNVERIGIERTYKAIAGARVVIHVFDETPTPEERNEIKRLAPDKGLVSVRNKADLLHDPGHQDQQDDHLFTESHDQDLQDGFQPSNVIKISAKHDTDLKPLEEAIFAAAHLDALAESDTIVTSARHRDALLRAHDALLRVTAALKPSTATLNSNTANLNPTTTNRNPNSKITSFPPDLIAEDLRLAIARLAEITGHAITPETTLRHIFSHFCVGK